MTVAVSASTPLTLSEPRRTSSPSGGERLVVPPVPANLVGFLQPRLLTRPLVEGPAGPCGCGCALTRLTSYGFAAADFARDVVEEPLDPWERWLVIHAGELLADGRPRFRRVLLLVARQNGKTHILKILAMFWLWIECWSLILGTSTNLDYARESWEKVVNDAEDNEALPINRNGVRRTNGEQMLTTYAKRAKDRCRYKIAAANRKGGRSLSIDRLLCDELREHHDYSAYNAAYNAMNARPFGQAWFASNMGDDKSVVLNDMRELALDGSDETLGLFEYSAPEGCGLFDWEAAAQANPNVGHRLGWATLVAAAIGAKKKGGDVENGYRTEVLCQRVRVLNAAISAEGWKSGERTGENVSDLSGIRGRVALCLDISPDGLHATLAAAAVVREGITWVEIVEAWSGPGCIDQLRAALPGVVARVKPRMIGWFPAGPAAALTTDLGKKRRPGWPPRAVVLEEIRTEVPAVCMGFAEQVRIGVIEHPKDDLMEAHVTGAEKLFTADTWVFSRRSKVPATPTDGNAESQTEEAENESVTRDGHCDAAYAVAGAVHLARTVPPPKSTSVQTSTEVAEYLAAQGA